MLAFRRTVSALALGLCIAGGASLAPRFLVPVAHAQESAETRLRSMLDMMGVPAEYVKWSSVEEAGSGLIVRGFVVDVAKFNIGLSTFPLGDWEITTLETDGNHVTRIESRFTNISLNLSELMETGQKLGQAGGEAASVGMGLAMMAGYIQGLGYPTLELSLGYNYAINTEDGTLQGSIDVDARDAFKFAVEANLSGVTTEYLDWARANMTQPEAMQKAMQDPNSPVSRIGFDSFSLTFDDQGLMPKFEPQLAMARSSMLGTNPDGSPKTEPTDEDIQKAAAQMAGSSGISPDKLEPVARAIVNFVMKPDVLHLAVHFDPDVTAGEIAAEMPTAPDGGPKQLPPEGAAKIDWNSRVSFEASN